MHDDAETVLRVAGVPLSISDGHTCMVAREMWHRANHHPTPSGLVGERSLDHEGHLAGTRHVQRPAADCAHSKRLLRGVSSIRWLDVKRLIVQRLVGVSMNVPVPAER